MAEVKYLTVEDLNRAYKMLAEPLPPEAIQHAETRAFKGYDSTGLGYQYCVNRFNEVVGPAHWNIEHDIIETRETGKLIEVTIHMKIQIGNWKERTITYPDGKVETINFFEVLAQRDCYGGHSSKFYFDALKGAYTNAFKKTAALFGVGRQAYEGSLDDDFINPDGTANGFIGKQTDNNDHNEKEKPAKRGRAKKEDKQKEVTELKAGQKRTIEIMLDRIGLKQGKNPDFKFNLDQILQDNFNKKEIGELNSAEGDELIAILTEIIKEK